MAAAPTSKLVTTQNALARRGGCARATIRASSATPATAAAGNQNNASSVEIIPKLRAGHSLSGIFRSSSASHTSACESDGARQSPRGDSEPPDEIFGPFGSAERLNWLCSKKRFTKTRCQLLISRRSKARWAASGVFGGHTPESASCQAFH